MLFDSLYLSSSLDRCIVCNIITDKIKWSGLENYSFTRSVSSEINTCYFTNEVTNCYKWDICHERV